MQNWVKRGHVGSRDPILVFWEPQISHQQLKLATSNLARRATAVSSNEKNAKLGQKWSCGVTWPNFGFLGAPKYLTNN